MDPKIIKAPPKIKVVLVKEDPGNLEILVTTGWKIAAAYNHAQGALFLLMKD